jgi:hypothetical protein
MELDCETARTDAVTLVTVQLRNERATDRRVRLENRLDGPVLPPRRNKEPEPGWDSDGVTTVVPPGECVALGYACPAEPVSPAVRVEWIGDADGTEQEAPVREAMRRLGDARPPRAVLGGKHEPPTAPQDGAEHASTQSGDRTGDGTTPPARVPSDSETVLQSYRDRVEAVEALGAADVATAAEILEQSGGLAGLEATAAKLEDDAATLRTLAAEAAVLAARAEAATPPTETLRRLS